MEDPDPVGHLFGDTDLMGAEKDGHALGGPFPKDIFHNPCMVRVEAHHRFVNDEDFGAVEQRAGDGDSLPCAMAEGFNGLV